MNRAPLLRRPHHHPALAGIVWDAQGHIVTNYHVIRGASDVLVRLAFFTGFCAVTHAVLLPGLAPCFPAAAGPNRLAAEHALSEHATHPPRRRRR